MMKRRLGPALNPSTHSESDGAGRFSLCGGWMLWMRRSEKLCGSVQSFAGGGVWLCRHVSIGLGRDRNSDDVKGQT